MNLAGLCKGENPFCTGGRGHRGREPVGYKGCARFAKLAGLVEGAETSRRHGFVDEASVAAASSNGNASNRLSEIEGSEQSGGSGGASNDGRGSAPTCWPTPARSHRKDASAAARTGLRGIPQRRVLCESGMVQSGRVGEGSRRLLNDSRRRTPRRTPRGQSNP
jgi:hypothetical protein